MVKCTKRRVTRVTPVQTVARNCTRDEGGPFEFGNQVLISSHRKLLRSKAVVVSVAETPEQDFGRHGRERRAQANRCRSVESGLGDPSGIRRVGSAKLDQAFVRNVRTCASSRPRT